MTRFHELDALRAFAMFLGVLLHAALFLIPIGWPETAKEASFDLPYDEIIHAIHGFRMPIFFLLSGFFTMMLWQRRGTQLLINHRLKRVGLPLLIGMFTIVPIGAWWWISVGEEEMTLLGLIVLIPFAWIFSLNLLWFLWVLLLLVGIFLILIRLGLRFNNRLVWWALIPLVLVPQLMMKEETWGADTSSELWTDPVVLAYYLCFFLFGAFTFQTEFNFRRLWAVVLAPAFFVFYVGLYFEFVSKDEWAHPVSSFLQVTYAWLMCFGLMGLFKLIASKERGWVRYLSDASYWIYLWHLTLIFFIQSVANRVTLNVHLEYLLVIGSVTAILLVTYHYGVRYTPIGTILNGPRFRRNDNRPTDALPRTTVN